MEVVSLSRLSVASIPWQPRAGSWALVVIAKATFALRPDVLALAEEAEPIRERDEPWDGQRGASVYAPADVVPFKPCAEIVVVGAAYAPNGSAVRSLRARVQVGAVDKCIDVAGDRIWTSSGLGGATPFTSMPLRYERAGRGDGSNPVGVHAGPIHGDHELRAPNLLPVGRRLSDEPEPVEAVGFGPIAADWPSRLARLGRYATGWDDTLLRQEPLPLDFDGSYFCCAPADQRLDALRGDEVIVLEHLHPDHTRLETRLPGAQLVAHVKKYGGGGKPLEMRADTLWIDTARGICTLTWRGQLPLERVADEGTIVLALEKAGATNSETEMADASAAIAAATPFRSGSPAATPRPTAPLAPNRRVAGGTVFSDGSALAAQAATPFEPSPTPMKPALSPSPPGPPPIVAQPAVLAPLPVASTPAAVPASSPDALASPWAGGAARPLAGPAPKAPLPAMPDVSSEPALRNAGAYTVKPAKAEKEAVTPAAAAPREIFRLLWFDPAVLPRVRKHPEWRLILAKRELQLLDKDRLDERDASPEAKDRDEIFEVLVRGQPMDAEAIAGAMAAASDESGRFEPPLVLVSGQLELPFDELETLKATVAVVTPLAAGDKNLKEAVDGAHEFLKIPWLKHGGGVAEGLAARIREAFAQGKRALPADYLESKSTRMLMEGRGYHRQTHNRKECIRALFTTSEEPSEPFVAFLPIELTAELPKRKRCRVMGIAEPNAQQDELEARARVIEVMALASFIGVDVVQA